MAQVQRIDLLQNNFACATAKFPATYPVFLSGKVTRDVFFADVEALNKIITDTAIGRRHGGYHTRTRTHYSLVVRDGEPVATGQVLGVAPPVNAVVVGASAPPAPSGFCTQCGAPMASDARFCGSCGAAR